MIYYIVSIFSYHYDSIMLYILASFHAIVQCSTLESKWFWRLLHVQFATKMACELKFLIVNCNKNALLLLICTTQCFDENIFVYSTIVQQLFM